MIRFALDVAAKDLRRRFRDPMSLLIWIGIPVAIAGMIRLAFGGTDGGGITPRAHVLVVDEDDSVLSSLLMGALSQAGEGAGDLPFLAEMVELEEGERRIGEGDASSLLVIPAGFGEAVLNDEPCTLRLVQNPAQRILPALVEGACELLTDAVFYAHRLFGDPLELMMAEPPEGSNTLPDLEVAEIATSINGIIEGAADLAFPPAIQLAIAEPETEEDEDGGMNFAEIFFPSMLFMTLFFLAGGISEDIWVERRLGTLRRAFVTPNRAGGFLLGKVLAAAVLVSLIAGAGFACGAVFFGVELGHVPLALLWTAIVGSGLTLLLILVQLWASSQRTGGLLTNLVTFPLLMIGGSFFPFEAMPAWMASIGKWTPNGWALLELKELLFGDFEPARFAVSVAGACAVCAVLFLIATRRMRGAFAGAM